MPSNNKVTIIAEPGQATCQIIREFEVPRELVFRAHVDPEMYGRWIGPTSEKVRIERWEPKDGGGYRWLGGTGEAGEYAFNGAFHEVTAPERIVSTFEFEGLGERGHVSLDVSTFEELPGGRSRLTIRSAFLSVEDRDGMIASGMEVGVTEGYEKLDDLLSTLAVAQ